MATIFWIIIGIAALCFVVALLASNKSDPKERAGEALGAAAAGASVDLGCIVNFSFLY